MSPLRHGSVGLVYRVKGGVGNHSIHLVQVHAAVAALLRPHHPRQHPHPPRGGEVRVDSGAWPFAQDAQ